MFAWVRPVQYFNPETSLDVDPVPSQSSRALRIALGVIG